MLVILGECGIFDILVLAKMTQIISFSVNNIRLLRKFDLPMDKFVFMKIL